ncbi:MAG TPA: hypothetical protein VFA29_10075 [Candidatus Baltobacteraceae bacterium]|nr:hypothetical protein [Candidatus Baltobacteraceae bacterium]
MIARFNVIGVYNMQKRILALISSLLAASLLAACSGGGGGAPPAVPGPPNNGGGGNDPNALAYVAISAMNAVGAPIQGNSDSNEVGGGGGGTGACKPLAGNNGATAFFAPDKANDPNSTERLRYYDTSCQQVATDTVRIITAHDPVAGTETVQRTITKFAPNATTPTSVRTETANYTTPNNNFDGNGYPIIVPGLTRMSQSQLTIGGTLTANTADEYIAGPVVSPSQTSFCGDNAGYNVIGAATLNQTFGWSSATDSSNGMRTVNPDGSVTFTTNRVGAAYNGPIGSMSINTGTLNTACPIGTPAFSINVSGGLIGDFSVPVQAQFNSGNLVNLTIANGSLGNGYTLNVSTNSKLSGTNSQFITGSINDSTGKQVANFSMSAIGIGALQVSTGQHFQIIDWHVVGQ